MLTRRRFHHDAHEGHEAHEEGGLRNVELFFVAFVVLERFAREVVLP